MTNETPGNRIDPEDEAGRPVGARFQRWTRDAAELFSRVCEVAGPDGDISDLVIRFYAPVKNPDGGDYVARANVSCRFFDRDIYGIGRDAAQAFFSLPNAVTSYLIGQRRFGFESYLFEKGDLDFTDFWTYRQ